MKFLKLKFKYITFVLLFIFIKRRDSCVLEGVLVLEEFVYQKSLSYAQSAIDRNKLCPGFFNGFLGLGAQCRLPRPHPKSIV